jgi:hypothetical protein
VLARKEIYLNGAWVPASDEIWVGGAREQGIAVFSA